MPKKGVWGTCHLQCGRKNLDKGNVPAELSSNSVILLAHLPIGQHVHPSSYQPIHHPSIRHLYSSTNYSASAYPSIIPHKFIHPPISLLICSCFLLSNASILPSAYPLIPSIHPSAYPLIHIFICLLSISFPPSIDPLSLSVHLSVHPSSYPSIHSSIYSSIWPSSLPSTHHICIQHRM